MNSNFMKHYRKDDRANERLFLSENISLQPSDTEQEIFHISNTASQAQSSDFTKKIGIHLSHEQDLILDGQNHTVSAEGKMIYLMLDHCKNITVENTIFRYTRPTVSEFTVISAKKRKIIVKIDPSSKYEIVGKRFRFIGPEGNYFDGDRRYLLTQEYDPTENKTVRLSSPFCWKKKSFATLSSRKRNCTLHGGIHLPVSS